MTAVITSTFEARATRQSEAERMKHDVSDRELIERFDELDALAAERQPDGP